MLRSQRCQIVSRIALDHQNNKNVLSEIAYWCRTIQALEETRLVGEKGDMLCFKGAQF